MLKSQIEKLLKDWAAQKLIDQEQVEKILLYESTRNASWFLPSLLLLGVLIISIGLISLIAANWAHLGPLVKVGLDFILLSILAAGIFKAWKKKRTLLFETLLTFYLFLVLASIGLISQIYHTGGELYQALLFWSLITVGIATISQGTLVPFLWVSGFLSSLFWTLLNHPFWQSLYHQNVFLLFMILPLVSFCLSTYIRHFQGETDLSKAFRTWTFLGALLGLVALEVSQGPSNSLLLIQSIPRAYGPGYILSLLSVWGIRRMVGIGKKQKIMMGIILALFILAFHLPLLSLLPLHVTARKFIYATFTLGLLSLISLLFASFNQRKYFQIFLVLLGLRFLFVYFQAIGGLALTGIGLIISGMLIITMVILWKNYHRALTHWVEKFFSSSSQ